MAFLNKFWGEIKKEEHKIERTLHHYHRRHRLHRGFLAGSFAATVLVLLLFGTVYMQTTTASQQVLFTMSIVDTAAVPVTSPSGDSGGGGSVIRSPLQVPAERQAAQPAIPFFFSLLQADGSEHPQIQASETVAQTQIPAIRDREPRFHGKIGLPQAIVLLEIHSDPAKVISVTLRADDSGFWEFQTPRPLEDGMHAVYLSIFDPKAEFKLGSSLLQFIVDTKRVLPPPAPKPLGKPAPSAFEKGELLFDARLEIPDTYHVINPGQNLLVQMSFLNLSSGGKLQDVTVFYRIKDANGKVVLEQSETLAVAGEQTFVRLFHTSYRLPEGKYVVEAFLPYSEGQQEAYTSGNFEVRGQPVINLASGAKMNLNLILQTLGLLLTVFALITYYEFKQVEGLARIIHHISERDLASRGLIDK